MKLGKRFEDYKKKVSREKRLSACGHAQAGKERKEKPKNRKKKTLKKVHEYFGFAQYL